MFYWFVESQSRPREDPLMLWTNGGPGCSGLGGFLSENGPFRASEGGRRLVRNDFSWNKVANMVFIEQPIGVGFSFSQAEVEYGDEQAAADNLRFVLGFLARYSLYASSDFFLSSESYGGHYLPTLARAIEEDGRVPQFKGIFLGNPLTYEKYRNYGQYGTGWGHQLLPRPLWQSYQELGCKELGWLTDEEFLSLTAALEQNGTADNDTAKTQAQERMDQFWACDNVTWEMDDMMDNFDLYALDFPLCLTDQSAGRRERWTLRHALARARSGRGGLSEQKVPPPYQPCSLDYVEEYLNRQDVQAAIGVAPGAAANWSMCSDPVFDKYPSADVQADMTPVWRHLVGLGKLKIMIYSGDDDAVCATMGTQEFIWGGLGLAPAERQQPGPRDGEAVCGKAEILHQLHIFLPLVEVVASNCPGVAVLDLARRRRERVPDAGGPAVLVAALDLVRRRGAAPDEVLREGQRRHIVRLRRLLGRRRCCGTRRGALLHGCG